MTLRMAMNKELLQDIGMAIFIAVAAYLMIVMLMVF